MVVAEKKKIRRYVEIKALGLIRETGGGKCLSINRSGSRSENKRRPKRELVVMRDDDARQQENRMIR